MRSPKRQLSREIRFKFDRELRWIKLSPFRGVQLKSRLVRACSKDASWHYKPFEMTLLLS